MPAINSAGIRPHIIAIGQIPPPMTGYAYITDRMIETLSRSANVETINISPGDRQGLRKHVHKARQTLLGCWFIARNSRGSRLLYLPSEGDWGLLYTLLLTVVARACRYTVYLHHHSFGYIDRLNRLMRSILVLGGENLHHVFLCSSMQKRFEDRYGSTERSYIISNAAFVKPRHSLPVRHPSTPIRIGLLSNLTRAKGLYIFLDLLRIARKADLQIEGILAGPILDAQDRRTLELAQVELGSAIDYRGALHGQEKKRFYQDIDFFVFPTQYANEAQPTVLFEALAGGNLIIAFDRGCIANQVGDCGLVIPKEGDFCGIARDYLAEMTRSPVALIEARNSTLRYYHHLHRSSLSAAESLLAATNAHTTVRITK